MRKTQTSKTIPLDQRILVTTPELKEYLGVGLNTVLSIGEQAKAKIKVGKSVCWHLPKIKAYLESIAE